MNTELKGVEWEDVDWTNLAQDRDNQEAEFDIYKLIHFLYNNVLVYNFNIKTLKNS